MKRASIFVDDVFCGILVEDAEGYHFKYAEEYEKEMMFPVFDGLIPEGWMLEIVHDNWKIDPRDRMSLLLACCKDCIGNISVREYGT